MKLMHMKKQITYSNQVIGEVYFGSHGVWVAQPNWSIFSKSFLSEEAATNALIEYFKETL